MRCSCRAASWQRFVQGLAQIHRLETGTTPLRVARPWDGLPARSLPGRSIHVSRSLRQEAVAVVPQPEGVQVVEQQSLAASQPADKPKDSASKAAKPKKQKKEKAEKQKKEKAEKKEKQKKEKKARKAQPASGDGADTVFKSKPKTKAPKADKTAPSRKTTPKAKASSKERRDPNAPKMDISHIMTPPPKHGQAASPPPASPSRLTGHDAFMSKLEDIDSPQPPVDRRPRWAIAKEERAARQIGAWNPRKKLSPDALTGIRALNAQFPEIYTVAALSKRFGVTFEAMRRILKSKWVPNAEEEEERQQRWHKRGMSVWSRKAELGFKPPKKWRREGITRDPSYHEWSERASRREREQEEREIGEYRRKLDSRSR